MREANVIRVLRSLGGVCILLFLWQILSFSQIQGAHLLASPLSALRRGFEMISHGELNADLLASFKRWLMGFSLAVIIGTPIGLTLGSIRALHDTFNFTVDFMRSLPVTALFPLFLIFFGVGDVALILMSFTATIFLIILNADYGVRTAPLTRTRMARSFGASGWQIFYRITVMEALPHILIGMRTSLSLSLIVAVVAEMFVGVTSGLGQRLFLSYQLQLTTDLFALLLIVGLLGYAANLSLRLLERRFSFWIYR